jgi:hypothetical protein
VTASLSQLTQKLRQLGDIRRDPPRLIAPVSVQVRRERAAKLFDEGVRRRQVRKTPAIGLICREL